MKFRTVLSLSLFEYIHLQYIFLQHSQLERTKEKLEPNQSDKTNSDQIGETNSSSGPLDESKISSHVNNKMHNFDNTATKHLKPENEQQSTPKSGNKYLHKVLFIMINLNSSYRTLALKSVTS